MTSQSMSRIDALYEAAQFDSADPWKWRRFIEADRDGSAREAVMALVEVYRVARRVDVHCEHSRMHEPPLPPHNDLRAAIEKVEALG